MWQTGETCWSSSSPVWWAWVPVG